MAVPDLITERTTDDPDRCNTSTTSLVISIEVEVAAPKQEQQQKPAYDYSQYFFVMFFLCCRVINRC